MIKKLLIGMRPNASDGAVVITLISLLFFSSLAAAQGYPIKPIRIYTGDAGSANDQMTRLIAQSITIPLGQPVVVENRGATLAAIATAKAPPDGYTLIFAGNALWLAPFIEEPQYDPINDFAPIAMVVDQPLVAVVHSSLPANSIKEFIVLAKAKPGALNYGSSVIGGVLHLAGELLKSMGGLDMVQIPFKGAQAAVTAVLANQVAITFAGVGTITPFVNSGRLKPLAITSLKRNPSMPNVPTMSESGLPGYEMVARNGILTTGKTPSNIVTRLNKEIVSTVRNPEIEKKLLALGTVPNTSTPEEFRDTIISDMSKMGKLIKESLTQK